MPLRIDAIPIPGLGRLDARGIPSAVGRCMASGCADPLRHLGAEAAFLAGNFDTALARYRSIRHDPALRARARFMDDWIRFHRGDVSVGWPRYVGSDYEEPAVAARHGADVRVAEPRRPEELTAQLGMRRWRGGDPPAGHLLVWFNFRNSLGGEILASRLIRSLQRAYPVPLVLACCRRLVDVFRATFTDCEVIDAAGDLRSLAGRCSHYVLARDLLGMLVRDADDFARPAAEHLLVPDSARRPRPGVGSRPQVAISWKTTNRTEGRFRNAPLKKLAEVLGRHDIDWHIAQHGTIAHDVAMLRRRVDASRIHSYSLDPTADIATFAGRLLSMDAVVTIDNSLLHLAGGLGRPTFGLLTIPAYWAWPAEGPESRWYASVHILRQERPGDWASVFRQLDGALRGHVFRTVRHSTTREAATREASTE